MNWFCKTVFSHRSKGWKDKQQNANSGYISVVELWGILIFFCVSFCAVLLFKEKKSIHIKLHI